MSFALLSHKNFSRTTANAGYTGVAIFNIRGSNWVNLLSWADEGDPIPDSISNYLERIYTLTQNIDASWSKSLTLQDGILTGANSDTEAEPGEALRSTSVGDRVSVALQTQFSGMLVYEFEVAKFGWRFNGHKNCTSLTEEA
jgi:hypothetical protein